MQLTPEQVQSINIILSAIQVAQRRGAFSLQDAHTLQDAIDKLVPREEQDRQAKEAVRRMHADSEEEAAATLSLPDEDNMPAADSE